MIKLLLLIVYIFSTSSIEYKIFGTVKESITKVFYHQTFDYYTILKYIPSCENNITTKNIYTQSNSRSDLYHNFSDIGCTEQFISLSSGNNLVKNLICGKEYYFTFTLYDYPDKEVNMAPFELTIINEDDNILNISPLLSNYYSFSQRTKKEEIFYYFSNERKYAYIIFNQHSKLKIIENDNIIYDNETENFFEKYEFKEKTNYTIIYQLTEFVPYDQKIHPINFQFYDEPKYFKHDFKKEPAVIYSTKNISYYFDIDISDYKLGENVVFFLTGNNYNIGYRFKNEKKFIEFETNYNYLSIKKTRDESSLLIYFQYINTSNYSTVYLFKVEEIKSEYNSIIEGPKLFLVEYNSINGMNSIGIESNKSFYIYEQEDHEEYGANKKSFRRYLNLTITKQNNLESDIHKRAFIYFNSAGKAIFTVKKLKYSIFSTYDINRSFKLETEYFQMCQGENSPNDLYFYIPYNGWHADEIYDIFSSIYGNFTTYFIYDYNIKRLSDLNFDNIEENNYDYFTTNGYLKINCTSPVMIKHSNIYTEYQLNETYELTTGKRYFIRICEGKRILYTFNKKLLNKRIILKFTYFRLTKENDFSIYFIGRNSYSYTKSKDSIEIEYTFNNPSENGFEFGCRNNILILAELQVGFLSGEYYNDFEIKDLQNFVGANSIKDNKKGVIIRIPKDFDDSLYNYSLILSNYVNSQYDVLISYDELQFIVPTYRINASYCLSKISPVIPLFKVNPYEFIQEEYNAFFYILIYVYNGTDKNFIIKKPILFSDTPKLKTLNIIQKSDTKYYYQIKIPKRDYNSLLIETSFSKNDIKLGLSENNILYPITQKKKNLYFYQFIINNNEKDLYLNYYETDSDGYINLVENICSFNAYNSNNSNLKPKIEQIEGENKIKIKIFSSSYYFYPDIVKYYLIINAVNYSDFSNEDNYTDLYSIIANKRKINKSNNEFMTIIEDKGTSEFFECEVDIDMELKQKNQFFIVPMRKENNLLELDFISHGEFNYINYESKKTLILIIVFSIIGAILIILLALILYIRICKKKRPSIEELNDPIVNDLEMKETK